MAEIKPEIKFEQLIKELTAGGSAPFPSIAELYVFAAAYGFSEQKHSPTHKPRKDQVRDITFKNKGLESNIYAIALAHRENLECLKDKDECYQIFQGYVNGGLAIIQKLRDKFAIDVFYSELLNIITDISQKNVPYDVESNLDEIKF